MTAPAWLALALALVLAAVDWYAVATDRRPLEYLCKPATMLALLGLAFALEPTDPTARTLFVLALVFSLAGDVFLMLPRDLFVPGLASFLLGHVAYVSGLLWLGVTPTGLAIGALVVTLAVSTLGRRIVAEVRSGPEPGLAGPVLAYIVVISVMVACAVGTGRPLAIAGSASFYASDALIAWGRFVQDLQWGRVAVMVTYHLGQIGLVLALTG